MENKYKLTVDKLQDIKNDIFGDIKYSIYFTKGLYMSGFTLNTEEAKELLEKLKKFLD